VDKHHDGPNTTSKKEVQLAFIAQYTKFANLSLREDDPPAFN
jgi:replicative DNA helicase